MHAGSLFYFGMMTNGHQYLLVIRVETDISGPEQHENLQRLKQYSLMSVGHKQIGVGFIASRKAAIKVEIDKDQIVSSFC